jgi:hypothetical protein
MAPPTSLPPPHPTPLSGTRESIQFPQHPLAAINGHRFLPKITISLQNIFHIFHSRGRPHPQPSGGSFFGLENERPNPKKSIASNNTPKRAQYILLRLSLCGRLRLFPKRSIIDAVGSRPSDPPPRATGTRTQHGPQRIIYYQKSGVWGPTRISTIFLMFQTRFSGLAAAAARSDRSATLGAT